MPELRTIKREPTGITISEDDWQFLCEAIYGETMDVLVVYLDGCDEEWAEVQEHSQQLFELLEKLCKDNGGRVELTMEE